MLGILGGGISGLSLAYRYEGPSEVVEREDCVGGHCRSHEKDGFRYDEGGHILFSADGSVLGMMLEILGHNAQRHYRNNKIWFKGRLVKYPFENGLSALDKDDIYECLYYFLNNDCPEPSNFLEWVRYVFGKGIAERYLIPYNEKVWKMDLSQISLEWVGGRVPRPPVEDVIKSALGIHTEGYTQQLYFYYPRTGGIEALPRALAQRASSKSKVIAGFSVSRVQRDGKKWVVSDGRRERAYDRLVCTMPVPEFLKTLDSVPTEVLEAATQLRCNSTIFVLVGLSDCSARSEVAIYFPQPDIIFNRVCFYHVYGGDCVPPGKYSAVAEITCPPAAGWWLASDQEITNRVLGDLAKEGFISPSDVLVTDVGRVRHSYVVYDHRYRHNVDLVRSYVRHLGIELLGRFGEFEYLNMDQCFSRALRLAERLQREV